jgi:hypothetical protein
MCAMAEVPARPVALGGDQVDQTGSSNMRKVPSARMAGECVDEEGADVSGGAKKHLAGGSLGETECLSWCMAYPGATGCERITAQANAGCYVHTNPAVAKGSGTVNKHCWALSGAGPKHLWERLLSRGTPFGWADTSAAAFDSRFAASPTQIVARQCDGCGADHRLIFYKRLTDTPAKWSLYDNLQLGWKLGPGNQFGLDFSLHSTYEAALAGTAPWQFCDGDQPGVGFPRNCRPAADGAAVRSQWSHGSSAGTQPNYAFFIDSGLSSTNTTASVGFVGLGGGTVCSEAYSNRVAAEGFPKAYYTTADVCKVWKDQSSLYDPNDYRNWVRARPANTLRQRRESGGKKGRCVEWGCADGGDSCTEQVCLRAALTAEVAEEDCLPMVRARMNAAQRIMGRTWLVTGSWDHVPPGCSFAESGDNAAHWNTNKASVAVSGPSFRAIEPWRTWIKGEDEVRDASCISWTCHTVGAVADPRCSAGSAAADEVEWRCEFSAEDATCAEYHPQLDTRSGELYATFTESSENCARACTELDGCTSFRHDKGSPLVCQLYDTPTAEVQAAAVAPSSFVLNPATGFAEGTSSRGTSQCYVRRSAEAERAPAAECVPVRPHSENTCQPRVPLVDEFGGANWAKKGSTGELWNNRDRLDRVQYGPGKNGPNSFDWFGWTVPLVTHHDYIFDWDWHDDWEQYSMRYAVPHILQNPKLTPLAEVPPASEPPLLPPHSCER